MYTSELKVSTSRQCRRAVRLAVVGELLVEDAVVVRRWKRVRERKKERREGERYL